MSGSFEIQIYMPCDKCREIYDFSGYVASLFQGRGTFKLLLDVNDN